MAGISSLITAFFIAAFVYRILKGIYTRYRPGLRDIPGPPLASWTRLWRFRDAWKGQTHQTSIDLHSKYGKLVRVGPNVVSISDPAMIPVIYDTSGSYTKTGFYPPQSITWHKRQHMNVFSTRDEAQHRILKKKVANAYTSDALLKMEKEMDDCGTHLVAHLDNCAQSGSLVDLGAWSLYYTFDVVGEITFSEKLGFLETGSDVEGMITASAPMMVYFACIGQVPVLHKFLLGNPIFPYLIPKFETANTGVMFTHRAMIRRSTVSSNGDLQMKEDCGGNDMLSRWAAANSRDPDKMSITDVMVAISTNIFAGADTTAISLRAIFYYLIKNPTKLARAVEEIDDAFAAGKLSDPIKERETRDHLPYMNAIIKEALRLHPAVGMMLERHVPPEGAPICGQFLPGSTVVGINPWVVHRNAEIFPDPDNFIPERWLGGVTSKEDIATMERSFLAFGAGSRICMGRNLSMIEMRKIVPRLLREFEISFEDKEEEWQVHTAWLAYQKMPKCIVRRRN